MDPEDLNFLSLGLSSKLFCAPIVDGNGKDVDESAVSIGMGMIALRGSDHDIGSCAEIDNIRMPLEVVSRVVDTQGFVNRYLASLVDIGVEDVFSSGFIVLSK